MATRAEILETLAHTQEHVLAHYQTLTPQELERPCTESAVPDQAAWRPQDHLVHLAMTERAFQEIIRLTLKGEADPVGFSQTGATSQEELIAWFDQQSQTFVDAHRGDSMETILADCAATRKGTLGLLEQLTDEQLMLPVPGALWADGTIGGIIITNAHHGVQHLAWVEEGLHEAELRER